MATTTSKDAMLASPIQKVAALVGAVFLLVGILGFIPGITTGDLAFAGHESGAELLGIFAVSVLHNLVHALFGVVGLLMARSWNGAKMFLIGGGAIYLVLWVYGLVVDLDSTANFVPVNEADNWLHLVLGLAMVLFGMLLGRSKTATTS